MKKKPTTLVELQTRLRDAGLRSTSPRVAVLRYLAGAGSPVSHGELTDAIASDGFDRATLYRNLVDLTEAGLVARRDLGDHVWRYELRRDEAGHTLEHPHFVCVDCGDVSCLPGVTVQIQVARTAPRAVSSEGLEVQLKGRCDRCA